MRDAGRCVVDLLAGLCAAVAVAEAPVAVSPGHADQLVQVEGRCPTFNWGTVSGAASYQLVVYRLTESDEEAQAVVRATVPGSATGWTPAMDQCLDRGGRYAWTVRAVGKKETSEWSTPALFQVAAPTAEQFQEALEVVRTYLALQAGYGPEAPATAETETDVERDLEPAAAASPGVRAAAPTELFVAQGVEAASFKGDGSELTALTPENLSAGVGGIDISGNAASASDLACTDCVSEGELDFDPSTQTELDAHKASGDHDARYVNTSGDQMTGALSMGSNVIADIGAAGTDFTSTGGLTLSDDLAIAKSFELPFTADSASGVVYKRDSAAMPQTYRFLHDFEAAGTDGSNLFLGQNAGNFTMSGGSPHQNHHASYNTGIGVEVLFSNTTGNANTATGFGVLALNTEGFRNTASGTWALQDNTVGSGNTAGGVDALRYNIDGGSNTAFGLSALEKNTTGSSNTAVGAHALLSNTGEANIALGHEAGSNITSGSFNIMVGYNIDAPSATGSNQMNLGNLIFATGVDGTGLTMSSGNVGIGTASPAQKLDVVGNVQATGFLGDGSGLTGVNPAAHVHDGADVTTGTVADARIDAGLARDAEVFGIVTASDGTGSGLDADLLDGNQATAFAPAAGSPIYVAKAGDAMAGNLSMSGNSLTGVSEVTASSTLQLTSGGSLVVNLDDDDSGVSSTFSIETNGTGSDLATVAESGLTSLVSSSGAGGLRVGNTNASATAPVLELFSDALSTSVFSVSRAGQALAVGFSGSGSGLTNLNASNLSSGTVPTGRLSGTYGIDISGNAATATSAGLSANADMLDSVDSTQFLRSDASDSVTAGTLTLAPGTTLDVDGAVDAAAATALSLPSTGVTGAGSGSGLDADLLDGQEAASLLETAADRRRVYLTSSAVQGDAALTHCTEPGFHMASIWEIADLRKLDYAKTATGAYTSGDLGEGLPAGTNGWIRTGSASANAGSPGEHNCLSWTTTTGFGTIAGLLPSWSGTSGIDFAPGWIGSNGNCGSGWRVWCAEDN